MLMHFKKILLFDFGWYNGLSLGGGSIDNWLNLCVELESIPEEWIWLFDDEGELCNSWLQSNMHVACAADVDVWAFSSKDSRVWW